MSQKKVFLWSTRRVLSMTFHRAIYQIPGIKHFCEPFALSFYFGNNAVSKQFNDKQKQELSLNWDHIPTVQESLDEITKYHPNYDSIFMKEHAMYAINHITDDILNESINTFIIRHPEKATKSIYRITLNKFNDSLWDHVEPDEMGFKELYLMYDKVVNKLKQDTIIIDADDLVSNPEYILKEYCQFVGYEYSDKLINWDDNVNDSNDKPWDFVPKAWVKDLKSTNRIRKMDKKYDDIIYPEYLNDIIEKNMTFYDKMYPNRIQLPK